MSCRVPLKGIPRYSAVCSLVFLFIITLVLFPARPGAAFEARSLGDFDNVAVMEVTGNYDVIDGYGRTNLEPRRTIAKEFYRTHSDDYDFLVIFTNFDIRMLSPQTRAVFLPAKNDVRGIGLELYNYTSGYTPTGYRLASLQGTIDMGNVAGHVLEPVEPEFDDTLQILTHEMMHRWGAYVKYLDNGVSSEALLGSGGVHWSFLLDAEGSSLYGNNWRDNGDGTFTTLAPEQGHDGQVIGRIINPLERYLMGLADKSQVPPLLLIDAPGIDPEQLPEIGVTVPGTVKSISIDDIIAAMGERIPSYADSRKTFRMAFIHAVTPGTWSEDDARDRDVLASISRLRTEWEQRFSILTDGAGMMHTTLLPPKDGDTNPDIPDPETIPATKPNVNSGIAWLISRQHDDGCWYDSSGTALRDTAVTTGALGLFPAGTTNAARGREWLVSMMPDNSDFLSRAIFAGVETKLAEIAALQNADGGWGSAAGFRSNPIDTALALQALTDSSGDYTLSTAIDWLHAAQNPDGGWNSGVGESMIQPTAEALLALNRHRKGFLLEPIIADALAWLVARQNADGGFGSPGTVIETALALQAIKATGASPAAADAAVNRLLTWQADTGSWNGSVFQTAGAVAALHAGQVAADLTVETADITCMPAQVITVPADVTVSVNLHNLGADAVSQAQVSLYAGEPAPSRLLGTQWIDIAGHGASRVNFETTIGESGLWQFHVVLDGNNLVAEASEWNNEASKSLTVNLPPPAVGFVLSTSSGPEAIASVPLIVNLSYPWSVPITVNYTVNAASTALASSDFILAAGSLVFAADQTSAAIDLSVINDSFAEIDKTVILDLSNPSLGTLGTSKHTYTIRDDEAPKVIIASPPAGLIGQNTPQLLYTTTGGNVAVKVDGTVVAMVAGNILGPLVNGVHSVEVSASNSFGVVTTARVDFIVDTSLPTIAVRSPLPGTVTNAQPLLDYTVTSAIRVEVLVDGVSVNSTSGSRLGPLAGGMHILTINAWNAAGAKNSGQVAFQVDARPPEVDILSPGNEFIREVNPVLRCRMDEAGQVSVWLDGIKTGSSLDQPIGPLDSGVHRLEVTVTDAVGNTGADEVVFAVATQDEEAYGVDAGWPKIVDGWFGGVAADRAGNIYVVTRRAEKELDIAKYDPAGRQFWRVIRSSEFTVFGDYRVDLDPVDVAVDAQGNIYIVGWGFSVSRYYSFLAKYDANGRYVNHKLFDTGMLYGNVQIMSVYVDANDQIYIAGNTDNDLFGTNHQDPAFSFVAKYSKDLMWLEGKCYGTSSNPGKIFVSSRDSIAVDKDQHIFIAGSNGNNQLTVWKLAPDLSRTGVEIVGSANTHGMGIDVDLSGNLYVSGRTSSGGAVWKYSSADGHRIPGEGSIPSVGFSSLEANEDGTVMVLDDAGTVRRLAADFTELWISNLGWDSVLDMVMSATGQLVVGGSDDDYAARASIAVMSDPRIPRFSFGQADHYSNGNPVVLSGYLEPGYDVDLESGPYDLLDYSYEPVSGSWQMVVDGFVEGENRLAVSVANPAGFAKRYETRVIVDTVAPHVAIQAPANGSVWTNKPWLSYTTSDGEVRVFINSVEVTKASGSSLDSLRAGENHIQVQSTDLAGNVGFAEIALQATGAAVGEYPLTINGVRKVAVAGNQTVIDAGEDAAGHLYVFGGTDFSTNLYVAKFDFTGNLLNFWPLDSGSYDVRGVALAVKANGEFSIAYNDPNNTSIHVDNYAADGITRLWSDVMSSGAGDTIHDLTIDAAGNLYACGETQGRLNNKRYGGSGDYFLIKYTPQGSRLWTILSNMPTTDALRNIEVGEDGFLYGMGKITDAVKMTLFKFDLNGTLIWSRDYSSATPMYPLQMKRGRDGNFYTLFDRWGSITAPYYYYVTKHDPQGNFVKIIYEQGDFSLRAQGLSLDAASNVYITGCSDDPNGWGLSFAGNRSFGDEDIFIAKYAASDLQTRWTRQMGDVRGQQGSLIIFSRINGRAYLAGIEDADFAEGSDGGQDLFFAPLMRLAELPAPVLTIADFPSPTCHRSQTLHGVTTPGATVGVSVTAPAGSQGRVSLPAQHADGTWSFTVDNLVANADNVLTVSASDGVGTTSKTVTIRVDALPPTLTVNPVDSPTNANSQVVTGSIEPGATLTVEVNPPAIAMPVTFANGTWNYTASLRPGDNTLVFTATDAVGNATVDTATITLLPPKLTISPETIQQGEWATVTLTIENFTDSQIQIRMVRDVAGDGSPADDPLTRLLFVTDGVPSNNPNVPGDEDGVADHRIVTTLKFDYRNDAQMAPGTYLFAAETQPSVATAAFAILPVSQIQTIQGYVLDSRSTPQGGATVQLLDKWGRNHGYAFTDAAGHYLLNVAMPGDYVLLPTLESFVFAKANLTPHTLAAGQHLSVDLPMVEGTYSVEGQVRDAGTLFQVQGGVLIQAESDQYVAASMTKGAGAYQLNLPAGDYDLFVDAYTSQGPGIHGYLGSRPPIGHVAVSAASTGNHLSLHKSTALICGQVRDAANMGVAGLVVEGTSDSEPERFATTVTDAHGNYCLGLMDEVAWRVALNDDADQPLGYVGNSVSGITSIDGPFAGVDLTAHLVEGAIEGVVRKDDMQPVGGILVKATCAATGGVVTVTTVADGSYRLGVHAGAWQVSIVPEALGYDPVASVLVAVAAGETAVRSFSVSLPVEPVFVAINPVVSPTGQASQVIGGSRSTDATVTVTVNTAASVGAVSYPTATTWQCVVSNLSQGLNMITASATGGTTPFTAPTVTIDYQPPQMVNTIVITSAVYDVRRKILNVQATTSHANAQLQVDNYGPMVYSKLVKGKYCWTFSRSLATKPAIITVSGPEGFRTATVR